ncbi:ROK family protein [Paractinoplanes rishiriensis]|uniref:ROK family protein n=1 Tax=Paractinoplanes rishiriensis TaxID=1050105 RepID=UPI001944AEE0|nr:ROK family protein [Actinoplanes rishiriensis]
MAVKVFATGVDTLGVAIGSAINLLDLDLVVIGGGLTEKLGQSLADRLAAAARPWMLQPSPDLRFVAAALGDDSGVVGAASLGRAALLAG